MRIYWIKAQAPRRVLALVKHLGVKAKFVEVDLMAGGLNALDYAGLSARPSRTPLGHICVLDTSRRGVEERCEAGVYGS
jgi:hypothetical protein